MTLPSRLLLLGNPTSHSLSPRIHNAALRTARIDLQYVAMDVAPAQLKSTLRALRSEGAAGNVTIPFKQSVCALCDHVTSIAKRTGAVNTFWVQDGALIGDNTDVAGFDFAARELLDSARDGMPARVTLLGAGGAAAAVAAAVTDWEKTDLVIWSRDPKRAAALAQRFARSRVEVNLADAFKGTELVVNATPVGMADDAMPVEISVLAKRCAVLDLVYRKGETPWVRAARDAGHPASDGLPMLIEQAARSFRRWLGVEPNREVMWDAVS